MNSFITTFSKFYPCKTCASDFRDDLELFPPQVNSRIDLSKYFCFMHNRVNTKLGKEEFDCSIEKLDMRWKYAGEASGCHPSKKKSTDLRDGYS